MCLLYQWSRYINKCVCCVSGAGILTSVFAVSVEQVVALFDYTAQNDDELSFLKDSVINVISKDEASWWKGELNGQMGMFPANYITPLSAAATDDPATSPATVSCKYLIPL